MTIPPTQPPPQENPQPIPVEPPRQQVVWEVPVRIPWVSYTLLGLTTLIFLLQLATQSLLGYDLPAAVGAKVNELIVAGQYWRLFTPVFLHANFMHFGFNMYALFVLGPGLERLYGHERFIYLYFLGALAGNTFSFLFSPNPSLGASTAIFALLAGQVVYIYQNRKIYRNSRAMLTNVLVILGINLLFSLSGIVDFWGHMGGLVGGLAFSWMAGPLWQVRETPTGRIVVDTRSIQKSRIVAGSLFLYFLLMAAFGIYKKQ